MGLFLAGILCASLAMLPGILDLALLPRFLCLAAFLPLVIYRLKKSGQSWRLGFDPFLLTYLAYVVFCSLTTAWSLSISEAIFESSKLWLGAFAFLLSVYFLKRNAEAFTASLLRLSVFIACLLAVTGFFQLSQLPNLKKEAMYLVTGLNAHKNLFSSFLFLNLFFLVLAALRLKGGWRVLSVAAIIASLCLLAVLRTKAVWIACGTSFILFGLLFIYSRFAGKLKLKMNLYVATGVLLVAANVFFLEILHPVIQKGVSYSVLQADRDNHKLELDQERLVVWDKTYHMIGQKPLAGVGMGNWQVYFPDATLTGLWRVEDLNVTFQRPHNDLLWILSETGLIGFNLFLISLFLLLLLSFKSLGGNKETRTEISLGIAAVSGFFVIAFFDFPKERMEHVLWINIIFALLYYWSGNGITLKPLFSIGSPRLLYTGSMGLLLFILAIGMLRYKGEYFTRLMYDHRHSGNKPAVSTIGNNAWSFAYTLDPTSVPLHWYTGNASASMGNYPVALKDLEKAYSYNPYNRNVLNDLGSAYSFNKNNDKAIALYEEAARISPRFDEPKLNLAALYIAQGNYEQANTWLSRLMHNSEKRTQYQKIVDLFRKSAQEIK